MDYHNVTSACMRRDNGLKVAIEKQERKGFHSPADASGKRVLPLLKSSAFTLGR